MLQHTRPCSGEETQKQNKIEQRGDTSARWHVQAHLHTPHTHTHTGKGNHRKQPTTRAMHSRLMVHQQCQVVSHRTCRFRSAQAVAVTLSECVTITGGETVQHTHRSSQECEQLGCRSTAVDRVALTRLLTYGGCLATPTALRAGTTRARSTVPILSRSSHQIGLSTPLPTASRHLAPLSQRSCCHCCCWRHELGLIVTRQSQREHHVSETTFRALVAQYASPHASQRHLHLHLDGVHPSHAMARCVERTTRQWMLSQHPIRAAAARRGAAGDLCGLSSEGGCDCRGCEHHHPVST